MHKSTPPSNSPHANTKNKKLFPRKLWDLINDEKYNFCLRWSDDGQLVYLNRDEFEDSYLKTQENQFHTQKAISFVRQMNMYGFRKVDDCYYENDSFKRGCEHLLKNMIRKHPNKGQSNTTELSNFLYHESPPSSVSPTGTSAASLLAPVPAHYIDFRQAPFGIPACDSNKSQQDDSSFIQYQADTHSPRDLTTTTSANNHLNIGSEHSNLYAFNSLLSSINSHLYQQPLLMQSNQANNQNLAFDIGRFSSLQHIYQHILSQHYDHASSTTQRNCAIGDDLQASQATRDGAFGLSPGNFAPSANREASSTSLLVRNNNKGVTNNTLASDNSYKDGSHPIEKRSDKKYAFEPTLINNDNESKRRDSKLNRAFKRGQDSLLDDGAANQQKTLERAKKMKIENSPEDHTIEPVISSKTKKYATNLVSKIASDRDAHFDPDVLCVASKYAQRFVEILFDTAQLIARHSNSSLSPGTNTDHQVGDGIVPKSDNINLNDLTSALKLLPSKISNILK